MIVFLSRVNVYAAFFQYALSQWHGRNWPTLRAADESNNNAECVWDGLLGIGLFQSKELVGQIGGELTIRSAAGEGTCFRMRLKRA